MLGGHNAGCEEGSTTHPPISDLSGLRSNWKDEEHSKQMQSSDIGLLLGTELAAQH